MIPVTHDLQHGWAHINGGYVSATGMSMTLRCLWQLKVATPDVEIEHYPGDGQFGFDLKTRKRDVILKDVWFESSGDAAWCMYILDELNAAGAYDLELQVHSDGTTFPIVGGVTKKMKVLHKGYSPFEKVPMGDGQVYKIGKITFEEAG